LNHLFIDLFLKIGQTDPNDQKILIDWYNSLESQGILNWEVGDLCQQSSITGVSCDSSNRVTTMYSFFLFSFSFSFHSSKVILSKN